MKFLKKFILFVFIAIFMLEFTACDGGNKKDNTERSGNAEESIKFSEIMALSKEETGEKIYNINDKALKEAGVLNNTSNIIYNTNDNVTVYTNIISQGTNITKNYISIVFKGKKDNIKDDYSYADLRLSPDGNRIALRSFSQDSPFAAKGLSVYNTSTGKKIDFDKNIIVSGDLYRWDSENNLLYYGVQSGEKDYGKIYSYDFQNSTRKIVFDKFNGYCTFFAPTVNGSFIYIENNIDTNNMYYYDSNLNKSILIGNTIDKIEDYVIDNKNGIVYFIGKEDNGNGSSVYKLTIDNKALKRITYDFPKLVDETGGMAIDNSGKLYFCGLDTNGNNIYMYLSENNSVNLVTNKSGTYHIIQNLR